jgi:predicted XRE-type DNA-binding protein
MQSYKHTESKSTKKGLAKIRIDHGTGNVFKDLGHSDDEAASLILRSVLMIEVERAIKKNRWTQEQAAKKLRVVQPRISELMTGQIGKFSIDMLVKYLTRLGKEVIVTVEDRKD